MSKNGKVNKIEVITCDMSLAFEKGFKDNFPLAQCVIDKFHIIKHANEATDAVRKNLVKTLAKTGDEDVLTHAKYAALKNVENLTEKQQAKYETIMTDKRCNDLARAICLREKLQLIMNNIYLTREEAYARLKKLITKLKRTRLEPLIKFANLLVNHLDEICNYFKYRYTNAKLEGMNNRIEAIKRRARGFRKIEYFKNMIWIEGGHLDFASIFKKNL
jgi:transposase